MTPRRFRKVALFLGAWRAAGTEPIQ